MSTRRVACYLSTAADLAGDLASQRDGAAQFVAARGETAAAEYQYVLESSAGGGRRFAGIGTPRCGAGEVRTWIARGGTALRAPPRQPGGGSR